MRQSDQNKTLEDRKGARILWMAASLVVIVAGLKFGAPLLVPIFLALFLAILSFPLLFWLKSKKVPNWLAILLAVMANMAIAIFLVLLAIQSVSNFQERAPKYTEKFNRLVEVTQQNLNEGKFPAAEYLSLDLVNPEAVLGFAQDTLAQIMSVVSSGFLVMLIMIFVLGEATSFSEKLKYVSDRKGGDDADPGRFQKITREVVQYLVIKTVVSMGTGLVIGTGVAILGLDFPVLWGLLAFALNYVPTVGSVLASIPAIALAIVQPGADALITSSVDPSLMIDWGRVMGVACVYISVNIVFGNFIEPMLMGRRLGLATVVVILSLVFWGWVWGPVGMLLSVPLTMIIKIMLENTEDLEWIAVLLSQWPLDTDYLEKK
ncbi:MAG: AI-2E family transporter [Verrucomicrobiota bacterium]